MRLPCTVMRTSAALGAVRLAPLWCAVFLPPVALQAQSPKAKPAPVAAEAAPAPVPALPPETPGPAGAPPQGPAPAYSPTWESQKQARTWVFNVPAPRGQICDRNGEPLVQQRVGGNLALSFPRPLQFQEGELDAFVAAEARKLGTLLGREITAQPGAAQKHYKNRPLLPWILLQNLSAAEQNKVRQAKNPNWELLPFYARH